MVNTCRYCAPELKNVGPFNERVDIYNLGIIINDIVSGCYVDVRDLPNLKAAKVDNLNKGAIEKIIRECIGYVPHKRPNASQVKVGTNID